MTSSKITRRTFMASVAALGGLAVMQLANRHIEGASAASVQENVSVPYPAIDWSYYLSVNPDVVGWVFVPGTSISAPVVAEREDTKGFYLTHTWDKSYDRRGAIALDAQSNGLLFPQDDIYVNIIYGHNNSDGSAFSELANYTNEDFALSHRQLFLLSPQSVIEYDLLAVEIANAQNVKVRSAFEDATEAKVWLEPHLSNAALKTTDEKISHCALLYTCSYTTYANERCCVFMRPSRVWQKDGHALKEPKNWMPTQKPDTTNPERKNNEGSL